MTIPRNKNLPLISPASFSFRSNAGYSLSQRRAWFSDDYKRNFGDIDAEWERILHGEPTQLSLFNHIVYRPLDALNRATGSYTILEKPLRTGSPATVQLPEWWPTGYERVHLHGRSLGGDGSIFENIVPLKPGANKRMYWDVEYRVEQAVNQGEIVKYQVEPIYLSESKIPVALTIHATGNQGFELHLSILNR